MPEANSAIVIPPIIIPVTVLAWGNNNVKVTAIAAGRPMKSADVFELFENHDEIFVLKENEVYKLNLDKTNHAKLFL